MKQTKIVHLLGSFLDRLNNDVILGAEGYLFELERRGYVKAGAYVPGLLASNSLF